MCGIIGAFKQDKDKKSVNEFVRNQLQDQQSRGMQGFGAVFINQDRSYTVKRSCEPTQIMIDLELNKSQMILLHHRTPTSSENRISQTHPILVDNGSLKYKYLLVHNGHISNHEELKKKHEELGFLYTTNLRWAKDSTHPTDWDEYNDSESLAIEVARYIETQTEELGCSGSWAFIALQINKEKDKVEKIFFGRNRSPLNMSLSWGNLKLSSEGPGDEIKDDILHSVDLTEISKKSFKKFTVMQSPLVTKTFVPAIPATIGFYHTSRAADYKQRQNWNDTNWNERMNEINEDTALTESQELMDEKKDELGYIIDNISADLDTAVDPIADVDLKQYLQEVAEILISFKDKYLEKQRIAALKESIAQP